MKKEINLAPNIREKIAYPYISSCRHAPKIGTKKKAQLNQPIRSDSYKCLDYWLALCCCRFLSSVSADITIAAFCYFLWPLTGRDGN